MIRRMVARPRLPAADRGAADRARGRRPGDELAQRLPRRRRPRARGRALPGALAAAETARAESLEAGLEAAGRELAAAGIEPEYLEARDAESLEPVAALNGRPVLVAVAAQVGGARLIDNVLIEPPERSEKGAEATMQRQMLKSKIHRATVTDCDVDYIGSITIDTELMAGADLITNEQVHVWDIDNGARFVTYVIDGEAGSGTMQVNGAAAHLTRARPQDHRRLLRRLRRARPRALLPASSSTSTTTTRSSGRQPSGGAARWPPPTGPEVVPGSLSHDLAQRRRPGAAVMTGAGAPTAASGSL